MNWWVSMMFAAILAVVLIAWALVIEKWMGLW